MFLKPNNSRLFLYLLISAFLISLLSCSDDTMTDPDPDPPFSFNSELNPGDSAVDFLSSDDFDQLVVEIQYMEGYRPTDEAISRLKSFLEERLNKNSITMMDPAVIPAGGQNAYSASQIRDLEEEHRTVYPEEGILSAYFIFVDGEWDVSDNVLGIVYYNTSMALFGEKIDEASGGLFQHGRDKIEATVMLHEFGHIIGLVNNGVDMQNNHQDEEHRKHCDESTCLMYYSVRTTDFFANVFEGTIPELDEACVDDLRAAGGR